MAATAVFPRQTLAGPDASGSKMTAVSVPSASIRGRPSSFAGTTCRRDRSRISATALRRTIRCRTDRSGVVSILASPSRPPATSQSYAALPKTFTQRTPRPSQLAANLSPEPFPGLPVEGKRAFPSLTVSTPNSSRKDISLQNRRDRRSTRRPHRPRPLRPVRRYRRADVSP